jgi:hypothetical protein
VLIDGAPQPMFSARDADHNLTAMPFGVSARRVPNDTVT